MKSVCSFVLALLLVVAVPRALPAATEAPYELHVILSLTGVAAFLGRSAQRDFERIETYVNAHGGIKGRPITFVISDDQTSPQIAVQIANEIIATGAPVFLGPQFTAPCLAIAPLLKNGPVMYCLAPTIHTTRGAYIFSASTSMQDDLSALLRYFRLRGWKRIGFITTTDAGGQELERSLDNALTFKENADLVITGREHFNAQDISTSAQLSRLKAANPQALIAWSTGTPTGTLLRGIRDVGIDLPIGAGNGNMTYAQMKQYADIMPRALYFPGLAPLSHGAVGKGPIADQQSIYFGLFKDAGVKPDYSNNLPWDAILVTVDALRHLGPSATSTQVRDYIMNLHGWAGTQGMYDFGDREQRGIGLGAVVIDKWDVATQDFIAVSRLGGYPK